MNLQSPGYKSELVFLNFDGKVEDRGDYLVMRTLTNPNFFWGNLLIYNRPPQKGDFKKWTETFKAEFTDPSLYHITFAWDSMTDAIGDVSEFLEHGFELEAKAVLRAESVNLPPKYNADLVVKSLSTPSDWQNMIRLQVESAHENLPRHEWESFYRSQSARYQAMTKAGLGQWFGAYLENKLVAGLGIFQSQGIGRYQIVCTHPAYRRQGLCGTLVYKSAQSAFQEMGVKSLIMCADPGYFALRIYESIGFKKVQTEHGVCWWDKERETKV